MAWILALVLQLGAAEPAVPVQGADLVLFVSPGSSPVGRAFQDETLPRIRASAERAAMTLRVINTAEGAPAEVTMTPLLFHQSAGGRSIYQGRSNNLERIEAFLRTSRFIVQDDAPWRRAGLPVMRVGRALIAAPCKITELTGELPAGHEPGAFEARARAAIYAGFKDFGLEESTEFKRSDRAFYLDFYPYVVDGKIYVSMALFSMFHCKEALWRTKDALSGPFSDLEEVFGRAAQLGEEAIARERSSTRSGDGFDPVPDSVPLKGWEAFGLSLPVASPARSQAGDVRPPALSSWPKDWQFQLAEESANAREAQSSLRFHFAPPLDSTAGEVGRAFGTLTFTESGILTGASGEVRCETASVTLGWEDLDQTVHGESMLDAARYPEASFVLTDLRPQIEGAERLVWGRPAGAHARGTFTMKGREIPIEVTANFEPWLHESGAPRLSVDATFTLRLEAPFGILGPDGPSPAKDTLQFDLALLLEPASESE